MPPDATQNAGMRAMTVRRADHPSMPVALFYPSKSPAKMMRLGPYAPVLAFNGVPELPLKGAILLSHGSGGSQLAHYNLAIQLAKNGYLVAAPQHPGDNWDDRSLVLSDDYFSERPRQLSRLLDALLIDSYWSAHIVGLKIGALGHSAGGFSVLALAGGMADRQQMLHHCATTIDDQLFCQLGGDPHGLAKVTGFEANEAERVAGSASAGASVINTTLTDADADAIDFDVRDPRIHAVFAMAPIGLAFAPASLKRLDVPLHIVTAQKDTVLTPKYHGNWLRARLPQAVFEEVANAGHFAFMAPPLIQLNSDAGDPGEDPPGFDRANYLLRLEQQVVRFFDSVLLKIEKARVSDR